MAAQNILIRLPNWLGDLLMARPLLHAVRATHPAARISALGPAASRLLEGERLWDAWDAWPPDTRRRFDRLRQDVALVLPPSFSSAWKLPRGIGQRIGFASEGRSWLLSHPIKRPARGEMHLSREYLRCGEPLGVQEVPLPTLAPATKELNEVQTRKRGMGLDGPHVVVAPGAAYGPAKRWPAERFVDLGHRLVARGLTVLVCGARQDRPIAETIAGAIGERARSLAGETSLEEQLALCATARATVSNDSGLAHLAAAAGRPTVVIFGSTSSAWTAPLGERVTVIQHAPVCSPCFRRTCRIGYRCLQAVEVSEVERACLSDVA